MINGRGRLRSRRRSLMNGEDGNPLETLSNLVDVMLVFACGLMIAVILHWNVDLSNVTDIITQEDLVPVETLNEAAKDGSLAEDFDSRGIVYEDPKTGRMYIVKQ